MNSWPFYSPACREEVNRLLARGGSLSAYRANPKVGVGPKEGSKAYEVERIIEKKFSVKHAIAVNSGTAALHAGLAALGVQGKEVVTSPYTFSATASAILLAGGIPRFADVNPHTFCITSETVKPLITKKTAAILPVHLFGSFQDLTDIVALGLPVVEDAAQAVGAKMRAGKRDVWSGTRGLCGAYSFNGTKQVPSGEGGALVTNDDKIAEKARAFINHQENFGYETVSPNYRMHELVAILAKHGLNGLDDRNHERRLFAAHIPRLLYHGIPVERFALPNHAYYCVPMVYKPNHGLVSRKVLVERLNTAGVPCGEGYIRPALHKYPAFRKYAKGRLPVVEELSKKTLVIFYEPWKGAEGGEKARKAILKAVHA